MGGYDTLAGAAAGQLTINGDEVEGPCNTAKVLQSVDVCDSVVHVVDQVLLPAEFCAGPPRRTPRRRTTRTAAPGTTRRSRTTTPGRTAARRAPMTAATTATARTPTEVLPASPGPLARRGRPPPTPTP